MYRVAFSWQTCVVHKSLTTSPPCPPLISVATLLYPVLPYRTLCCSTHMPYSFMTPCPWTCCSFWNYHLSCSPRQSQNVSTWSPSHSSQAKLMFQSLERPLCVCVCVYGRVNLQYLSVITPAVDWSVFPMRLNRLGIWFIFACAEPGTWYLFYLKSSAPVQVLTSPNLA